LRYDNIAVRDKELLATIFVSGAANRYAAALGST
jgi:hypothetical protein